MANYDNRKWVILNISDVTTEMLGNSLENGIVRKSLDDTKTILKWNGDTPSCFDGMTTYTHSEILTILANSDWSSNE